MARYKYSDEDLIDIIQDKAKELGRVPTRRDVKQFYTISKRFGSWNNALRLAGFDVNYQTYDDMTKDDCVKLIQQKTKELGRTPYRKEWDKDRTLPSSDFIRKKFDNKTWYEIMAIAGFEHSHISFGEEENHSLNQFSNKEILNMVRDEINRLGTTRQTVYELNKRKESPTVYYLKKRFNTNSWNDILLMLGYSEDDIKIYEHNKEDLIKVLQNYYNETGFNPTINAMNGLGYSHKVFSFHFGSFNNALIEAGLTTNHEPTTVIHTDEELLQMYKDLCKKLGRAATGPDIDYYLPYKSDVFAIRFGGLNNLRELAGYEAYYTNAKYTKKEIKNILINTYKEHGRRLTNKELNQLSKEDDNFPSISSILRHFSTTKMSEVWEEIERI